MNIIIYLGSFILKLSSTNVPIVAMYLKGRVGDILVSSQVTSTRESLLRHCYSYKEQTSPYIDSTACLRLNNLSISRIGCVEKILWVQLLDLSHNELGSIDGMLFDLT